MVYGKVNDNAITSRKPEATYEWGTIATDNFELTCDVQASKFVDFDSSKRIIHRTDVARMGTHSASGDYKIWLLRNCKVNFGNMLKEDSVLLCICYGYT